MIARPASFRNYKELIVYQKAKENARELFVYYNDKKLTWVERFVIEQLLRATSSIGANIAEGYGRQYKREYRRFIGIARGSAFEVDYRIEFILLIRPFDKETLISAQSTNVEIMKILTTIMRKLDS